MDVEGSSTKQTFIFKGCKRRILVNHWTLLTVKQDVGVGVCVRVVCVRDTSVFFSAVVGPKGNHGPVQVLVFLSVMLLNRDMLPHCFLIWAGFFHPTAWAKQHLLVCNYWLFIEASKWLLIVINETCFRFRVTPSCTYTCLRFLPFCALLPSVHVSCFSGVQSLLPLFVCEGVCSW